MIRSICVWLIQFCVRHVTSWPWPRLLSGLACSFILLGLQQQFLAQLGYSAPVTAAAWTAVCMALALAWGTKQPAANDAAAANLARSMAVPALLAAISLLSPLLWGAHDFLFSAAMLGSRWMLFGYAFAWSTLTVGIGVWCVGRLSLCQSGSVAKSGGPLSIAPSSIRPSASFLLGVSIGLAVGLTVTWGSLYVTAIVGSTILLAAQFWQFANIRKAVVSATFAPNSISNSPATSVFAATSGWSNVSSLLLTAACGGLGIWTLQILELLFPATIFVLASAVSGVLFGVACGCRMTTRQAAARPVLSTLVHGWTVLAVLGLSAGFSLIVFQLVTLTGSVSQVWLLHSVRWVLAACCLAPLGYVWTLSVARLERGAGGTWALGRLPAWCQGLLVAMLGGGLTSSVLIPASGFNLTCYAWLWVLVASKLIDVVLTREIPRNTLVRGFAVGCLGLLAVAPATSRGVRPEMAARLLFSTNVFLADQAGTMRRELPFLDDGRLEAQAVGENGIYTVWKSSVARHQVRENGIPRGNLSTNSEFCPQDSSEVLLSLLPLTLHEEPRRVAILGLGSSIPLQTSLASPVLEVNSVEADSQLVAVIRSVTGNTEAGAVWQDERLVMTKADPALWVAGSGGQYDVVISNAGQSALMQNSATYTQEFYRRAARCLSANGIFCQRFQFVDYGPGPLKTTAATLRGIFRHVLAVEIGNGEIAWLATNSEEGLIRKNLVDRMQAPHVRNLMSQVGWDWSVLLTLAAYDHSCWDKILEKSSPGINTAANGRFCTQLPGELMRWGAKAEEIQKAVTVHASKILNWIGEAGTDDDLLRRLAEVRGQQELVANFPDQYWGYRSQVRKQISTRPVSRIQQVKHEADPSAGLHPDDKRRLRYFQQLSKAIHGQQPQEVERLADFSTPYDPLISLFMHQELAEIAAQIPALPARLELTHRLHMIYYSPNVDTSVRNPLSALRLVLEKSDCVTSNAERWDVINGLLQILQTRWELRGNSPAPTSNARLVARDVEENIVLVERALELLPHLRTDVGFSESDWDSRKRSIERNLLRPLREYRERLQPMATQQRMDAADKLEDSALPSNADLQFPGSDATP